MKSLAVCLALSVIVGLSACSSSNGGGSIITPVQAQAAYSNASLSGAYSVVLASPSNTPTSFREDIGTLTADGAGNITSGTLRDSDGSLVCTVTLTGTYSLQSNASGTMSLNMKSTLTSGTGTCRPNATIPFIIYAAQQGSTVLFNESDNYLLSGTAFKQ